MGERQLQSMVQSTAPAQRPSVSGTVQVDSDRSGPVGPGAEPVPAFESDSGEASRAGEATKRTESSGRGARRD